MIAIMVNILASYKLFSKVSVFGVQVSVYKKSNISMNNILEIKHVMFEKKKNTYL